MFVVEINVSETEENYINKVSSLLEQVLEQVKQGERDGEVVKHGYAYAKFGSKSKSK